MIKHKIVMVKMPNKEWVDFWTPKDFMKPGWETWLEKPFDDWEDKCTDVEGYGFESAIHPEMNKYNINFPKSCFEELESD